MCPITLSFYLTVELLKNPSWGHVSTGRGVLCATVLRAPVKQLSPSWDLIFYKWGLQTDLFLFNGCSWILYSVDVAAFSLLLELYMNFERLIKFQKSNQLPVWLKPHTTMSINKWCLPHWVMEVIAAAPCRPFTVHYIPTDTEWMLEKTPDYYRKTSRSANLSRPSCMYLGARKKYADIILASHFSWEGFHYGMLACSGWGR